MTTQLLSTSKPDLEHAAAIIRAGGLVGIPTETVYGLGANGLDPVAVRHIFEAKGRPQDNPLILHVSEAAELNRYCHDIPESAWILAQKFWPGPLTMVLPVRQDVVPAQTVAGHDTVAMRCPKTAATRELIRLAGVPIAAPSANLSGKPSTTTAQHVIHDLGGKIEAVIDGGPCQVGVESTIIDLTVTPPRLLRPGGVTLEELRGILGEVDVDPAVVAPVAPGMKPKAPGMKYKHYAPAASVIIVAGSRERAAAWIRRHFVQPNAVLCFEEELPLYRDLNPTVYGYEADVESLSHNLFAALRELDHPEIGTIFARCPEGGGLARAVQNRLKKSAGFHIVDADRAPQLIGVTGPTGAGKTTALRVLEALGGAVFDSDAVYHELLTTDNAMLDEIEQAFPGAVVDGVLDTRKLAPRVYGSPEAMKTLSGITHPHVIAELWKRIDASGAKIAVVDAIGLFESGLGKQCDRTVAIVADEDVRIRRLVARDHVTEAYARARIAAQKPAAWYADQADLVLENNGTEADFEAACRDAFSRLLSFQMHSGKDALA